MELKTRLFWALVLALFSVSSIFSTPTGNTQDQTRSIEKLQKQLEVSKRTIKNLEKNLRNLETYRKNLIQLGVHTNDLDNKDKQRLKSLEKKLKNSEQRLKEETDLRKSEEILSKQWEESYNLLLKSWEKEKENYKILESQIKGIQQDKINAEIALDKEIKKNRFWETTYKILIVLSLIGGAYGGYKLSEASH